MCFWVLVAFTLLRPLRIFLTFASLEIHYFHFEFFLCVCFTITLLEWIGNLFVYNFRLIFRQSFVSSSLGGPPFKHDPVCMCVLVCALMCGLWCVFACVYKFLFMWIYLILSLYPFTLCLLPLHYIFIIKLSYHYFLPERYHVSACPFIWQNFIHIKIYIFAITRDQMYWSYIS